MRARDNPFAVHRTDALPYRLPGGESWEGLLERLAAMGWRAAIVGPKGHGKTTLLAQLTRRLAAREREPGGLAVRRTELARRERPRRRPPWSRAPGAALPVFELADPGVLDRLTSRDLLVVDGADCLPRADRRRLLAASRGAGGLLVTTHAPGLLPTLIECETSPELLADLVRELHPRDAARLEPRLAELHTRHRGNLRDALRELYDLYAALPA